MIRCARCRREVSWLDITDRPEPEEGLDRLLCKHCWTVLVLRPEKRKATS